MPVEQSSRLSEGCRVLAESLFLSCTAPALAWNGHPRDRWVAAHHLPVGSGRAEFRCVFGHSWVHSTSYRIWRKVTTKQINQNFCEWTYILFESHIVTGSVSTPAAISSVSLQFCSHPDTLRRNVYDIHTRTWTYIMHTCIYYIYTYVDMYIYTHTYVCFCVYMYLAESQRRITNRDKYRQYIWWSVDVRIV